MVWENVPGVLSSNGGRDFGTFLWALGELGYGFAYRTLDAQYFGVSQRRRRVFVVRYLGDWKRAGAVLFERHSLSGNTAPRREKREKAAKCPTSRVGQAYDAETEQFITDNKWPADIASTLNASFGDKQGLEDQHINSGASLFVPAHEKVGRLTASYGMGGVDIETKPVVFGAQNSANQGLSASTEVSPTLDTSKTPALSYNEVRPINSMTMLGRPSDEANPRMGSGIGNVGDPQNTLSAAHHHAVQQNMKVRRLTPLECNRLQGFPDDYTRIPYRNKNAEQCPDSPRYKAIGNSMAVPVMRWIGERIEKVRQLQ